MTHPAGINVKTQDIASQLVRFSKSVPSTLAFVMRNVVETHETSPAGASLPMSADKLVARIQKSIKIP